MKKRFYGELSELNDDGRTLFRATLDEAKKVVGYLVKQGFDLRDGRSVVNDAINTAFAEEIMLAAKQDPAKLKRRAADILKKEGSENEPPK